MSTTENMVTSEAFHTIGYIEGMVKAADIVRQYMTKTSDPRVIYDITTALKNEVNRIGEKHGVSKT